MNSHVRISTKTTTKFKDYVYNTNAMESRYNEKFVELKWFFVDESLIIWNESKNTDIFERLILNLSLKKGKRNKAYRNVIN